MPFTLDQEGETVNNSACYQRLVCDCCSLSLGGRERGMRALLEALSKLYTALVALTAKKAHLWVLLPFYVHMRE